MKFLSLALTAAAFLLSAAPSVTVARVHDGSNVLSLRSIDEAAEYAQFLRRELAETKQWIRSESEYEGMLARQAANPYDYDNLFARAGPYKCIGYLAKNGSKDTCTSCTCANITGAAGDKTCKPPSNKGTPYLCGNDCGCRLSNGEKARMDADDKAIEEKGKIDNVVAGKKKVGKK